MTARSAFASCRRCRRRSWSVDRRRFPGATGPGQGARRRFVPADAASCAALRAAGVGTAGDAAHTINPLAGQGVNLGYRDVDALLNVLSDAREQGEDWSSEAVLLRYQRRRRTDNLLMQSGMDLFYTAFSNNTRR